MNKIKYAAIAATLGVALIAAPAMSQTKSPVFGKATATVLSDESSSKVVGKGRVADYFGYYGNLYSSYANFYGTVGYNYDAYSTENAYYYYAYYFSGRATAYYYYAWRYAGT